MSSFVRTLVVASVLLGASVALARDGKVYPAIACTPVGQLTVDVLHLIGPGIRNFTDNHVTVYCPVIKDYVYSTDGIRGGQIWFTTVNDVPVFADFWSRSQFGANYHVSSAGGDEIGDVAYAFEPTESLASGLYYLRVQIPPGATFHGYRFDESL